jgi:hypothetical protein
MTAWRRWWPDLIVLVGIAWMSYACSAYAGDGAVDGQLDDGGGDVSGDFTIGYTLPERANIVAASTVTAFGVLAKINRRDPPRESPPPVA